MQHTCQAPRTVSTRPRISAEALVTGVKGFKLVTHRLLGILQTMEEGVNIERLFLVTLCSGDRLYCTAPQPRGISRKNWARRSPLVAARIFRGNCIFANYHPDGCGEGGSAHWRQVIVIFSQARSTRLVAFGALVGFALGDKYIYIYLSLVLRFVSTKPLATVARTVRICMNN